MPRSVLYVVSYDVEQDRERSRVAKLLEGYGVRLQKSVFECRLSRSALRALEARIEGLNLESGGVLIFRLDDTFRTRQIGQTPQCPEGDASDRAVVA